MDQFVCVRMVQGNGMDLSLFQFDYDMSFAVFFLNADRTIYGRYGTRSERPKEAHTDISLEGLAEAMKAALALHKNHPANRPALARKSGPPSEFPTPERMPGLRDKFRSELAEGDRKTISRSCIHCHQIRDAERRAYFARGEELPAKILYPWPLPEVIGMRLDRKKRATLQAVDPASPAGAAGLEAGDQVLRLDGQPVISIADVQWVLHQAGASATLEVEARRPGRKAPVSARIRLAPGWRERSDISWRVSSWELRRMTSGGILLTELNPAERRERGLREDTLALRAEHVGQYGDHAAAKRAGFRKNDVIVSYDGKSDDWRETDFFAYVLRNKKAGQRVPTTVLRGQRRLELQLPVQD